MWQAVSAGGTWSYGDSVSRVPTSERMAARIDRLADRLRNVQIAQGDFLPLLLHHARKPRTVLYLDPPYKDTTCKYTDVRTELWDDLEAAVIDATADIAISCSPGDYPCTDRRRLALRHDRHMDLHPDRRLRATTAKRRCSPTTTRQGREACSDG